jgi:hypothetical protein
VLLNNCNANTVLPAAAGAASYTTSTYPSTGACCDRLQAPLLLLLLLLLCRCRADALYTQRNGRLPRGFEAIDQLLQNSWLQFCQGTKLVIMFERSLHLLDICSCSQTSSVAAA